MVLSARMNTNNLVLCEEDENEEKDTFNFL